MPASIEGWWMGIIAATANNGVKKVNDAVEEVIRKLVQNPKFEEAILKKIGARIDTSEVEKEIEELEKQHRQLTGAKNRLGQQMDSLDITDRFYEKNIRIWRQD